jgi:hypothetical protein
MFWNDLQQCLVQKLIPIHNSLTKFTPYHSLRDELPEQIMACYHLKEDDRVLELGGSIGRNTCIINSILKDKTKHVVLEPSPLELIGLGTNKINCNLGFQIEPSAISNIPLYSKGWYTFHNEIPGSIRIHTINYNDLISKYDISFTTLVIDNEGNFPQTLKDFPNILENIRLLIIEHDFNSQEDINFFYDTMTKNGFELTTKYLKDYPFGPGIEWSNGIREDPIFVSAWVRNL